MLRKTVVCDVKTEKGESGPTRWEAIASTGQQDRDGEFLEPSGCIFEEGAPLLYGHDYSTITSNIGLVETAKAGASSVVCTGVFDDDIPQHTNAVIAAEKAKKKRLQKLSVGFVPEVVTRADGQVITLSPGEWMWSEPGNRYTRWRMVELSFVPVPSNSGAELIAARGLDGPQGKELRELLKKALAELLVDSEFLDRLRLAQAAPKSVEPDPAPVAAPAAAGGEERPADPLTLDFDALLAGEEPARVGGTTDDPAALAEGLASATGEDLDLDHLFAEPTGAGATGA